MRSKTLTLILSLNLITISSIAKPDFDVHIPKDAKAEFEGILVPLDHYRKYSEALQMNEFYQREKESAIYDLKNSNDYLTYGLGGLVIGLFSGLLLKK